MRQRLGAMKCAEGGNVEHHIDALVLMKEDYATIGGELTDAEFRTIILGSVPPTYKAFLRSVMTSASLAGTSVTADCLCAVILEYYREFVKDAADLAQQTTTSPNVALVANAPRSGDRKFTGKCHNCKKQGHKKYECRQPGGGAYNGDSTHGKSGTGTADAKAQGNVATASDSDHGLAMYLVTAEAASIARTVATDPCFQHEIYDTGATCHMSPYREDFAELEELDTPVTIAMADGRALSAIACGTVVVTAPNGNSTSCLLLRDALYAPGLAFTLVSISRIDKVGYSALFTDGQCCFRDPKGQQIANIARSPTGLYQVQRSIASANATQVMSLDEFHCRMGHLSIDATKKLVNDGMVEGIEIDDTPEADSCSACMEAKMTHVPFPKHRSSPCADSYGQLVHSDLCGPLPCPTISGKEYFILHSFP